MKKLGIIGGMGSVAASYIFNRIIELTPAKTDQEYIEIFIHNNTAIPDRTQGVLFGGESPLPELRRSISLLNDINVDYIILACMTSHYFIPQLQLNSKAIIIDGIDETVRYIKKRLHGNKNIGIIASLGAIKISIFQKVLDRYGLKAITLSEKDHEKYFTEPIYKDWGIKAGNIHGKPADRLHRAAELLVSLGAETIILGCSELPLVFKDKDFLVPLIDSVEILCKVSINKCLNSNGYSL